MILNAGNAADRRTLQTVLGLKNTSTRQKASKYKNKITYIDNHRFHSQGEARRYVELKLRQEAGEILNLRCQPKYPLRAGATKICVYVADFEYFDKRTDRFVVEDFKGCETAVFKLKAKLFRANYGFDILVTRK